MEGSGGNWEISFLPELLSAQRTGGNGFACSVNHCFSWLFPLLVMADTRPYVYIPQELACDSAPSPAESVERQPCLLGELIDTALIMSTVQRGHCLRQCMFMA